jgi:hypothetical protein
MLRRSGENSAKKPVRIDDRMVLMAASEGGGMDSIVKWRKNLHGHKVACEVSSTMARPPAALKHACIPLAT